MIRHIVFFSARDPRDADRIAAELLKYRDIPGVEDFEIGRNRKVDQLANEVDVVLHARFASEEALAAYKRHPIYAQGTKIVRPLRELRIAVDYEWGSEARPIVT